jgi:hypothetical protein
VTKSWVAGRRAMRVAGYAERVLAVWQGCSNRRPVLSRRNNSRSMFLLHTNGPSRRSRRGARVDNVSGLKSACFASSG